MSLLIHLKQNNWGSSRTCYNKLIFLVFLAICWIWYTWKRIWLKLCYVSLTLRKLHQGMLFLWLNIWRDLNMYGGLPCWFWLDNACEKMWADLLMPEDIANIDWLNSLVDWAIIRLIDESLLPNLAWIENLLEIHWEVFGPDLKLIVFFANAFSYHRLIWE